MPASSYTRIVLAIGALSLVHCAYSAAQHRSYLRLTEQEFTYLPLDILVQTFISLFLVFYTGSGVAGEFQPIRADITMRNRYFETVANCSSFYVFDHRAKALSPFFASTVDFDRN